MQPSHVGAAPVKVAPITQEQVNKYVQICATIRENEKARDNLRLQVIASFEAGYPSPKDGPFVLELSHQERSVYSWKDICQSIMSILGERLRKQAEAIAVTMQQEKNPVAQVNIRPNADWRAE